MFSDDKAEALKARFEPKPLLEYDFSTWERAQLRALRSQIDQFLPDRNLSSVNLESELLDQYEEIKDLQREIKDDDEIPPNQKAQVANSVISHLESLVRMQERYHTAERFKAIENLLIKHVKTLPRDVAEQFLDEYEKLVP